MTDTDRTCGGLHGTVACAWWTHKAEKLVAATLGWCHEDRTLKQTECGWWCRHHAITRGWGDVCRDENAQLQEALEKLGQASVEVDRLKTRCREARRLIDYYPEFDGIIGTHEWHELRAKWLEVSDDE